MNYVVKGIYKTKITDIGKQKSNFDFEVQSYGHFSFQYCVLILKFWFKSWKEWRFCTDFVISEGQSVYRKSKIQQARPLLFTQSNTYEQKVIVG